MVPRIGFGTMGLSYSYGAPLPDEQRLAVLDRAYEIGETFWDSSDIYVRSLPLIYKLLYAHCLFLHGSRHQLQTENMMYNLPC